jgi:SAM-dependent methyltransferase
MTLKGGRVTCSDLWGAKRRASALHERYGVTMVYEDIDITAIPYEDTFDIIVFKSVLGALGDRSRQRLAVGQMHKALGPGGVLLFAENAPGGPLHRALRRRFRRARHPAWRYVSLQDFSSFLQPFSTVETKTTGVLAACGMTEAQRVALASVDEVADHCVPAHWRYVIYGVARK